MTIEAIFLAGQDGSTAACMRFVGIRPGQSPSAGLAPATPGTGRPAGP
jgi:hypothetical protein